MANRPKRATVKDVAELAGVSWKTVTNVMHGRYNVRESTRQKVLDAAAQVGYRASLAGRQLRSGRTDIIALAVPEMSVFYFAHLAHRFIEEGDRRGLTVFIYETFQSAERERVAAQGFDVAFADGVILSPVTMRTDELVGLDAVVPLVVLGESVEGVTADHIAIDNVTSAGDLTRHLVEQGRAQIYFIGGTPGRHEGTDGLRQRGWREELIRHGLTPPDEWVWPADFSLDGGYATVKDLLDQGHRPDALVCGNDDVALGALHALRQFGLKVPDAVMVAGWDDAPAGRFASPTLTTVKPDVDALVTAALDSVMARINGDVSDPKEIVVAHKLEVRESTTMGSVA